jgi:rhomboid protease GluP
MHALAAGNVILYLRREMGSLKLGGTEYDPAISRREPVIAYSLLVAIIVVFAFEAISGAFASRSPNRLIELGGAYGPLIREGGQWWRLFSAIFLHANLAHIAFNGIALVFAGYVLEHVIGRAWFATVFAVSGIAGGLFSLAFHKGDVVLVGASGAIMGLIAAALALSLRYDGETQTCKDLRSGALLVLVPSLIPSVSGKADIAAHFGGAFAGGALGIALLALWAEERQLPPFQSVAAVIAVLGLGVTLLAFGKIIFG